MVIPIAVEWKKLVHLLKGTATSHDNGYDELS